MAKKRPVIVSSASKVQRAQNRAALGRLRDIKLEQKTLIRYCNAVLLLLKWLASLNLDLPGKPEDWDDILYDYAEHCWESGECLGLFGDTLSGLPHFVRGIRGKLKDSWKRCCRLETSRGA